MLRRTLPFFLVAALLGPYLVEATTMPIPTGPMERTYVGYDWLARTHATHMRLDATPYVLEIALDDVPTAYIDLELTGLATLRRYELVGAGVSTWSFSNEAGEAVFWNVGADPGALVLVDGKSGEPVSVLMFHPPSHREHAMESKGCPWYNPWCKQKHEPPKVVKSEETSTGMAVEQAAYSFTEGGTIEVMNGWAHRVTIRAEASVGVAVDKHTAGGDLTYIREEEWVFVSKGTPVEFRRGIIARNDTYEDGSYKIYATGETKRVRLMQRPDIFFPPPSDATIVEVDALASPPSWTVSEKHAGAVFYERGVEVFNTALKLRIEAAGSVDTKIKLTFEPPAEGTRRYLVKFGNAERENTGLIAMIWERP